MALQGFSFSRRTLNVITKPLYITFEKTWILEWRVHKEWKKVKITSVFRKGQKEH